MSRRKLHITAKIQELIDSAVEYPQRPHLAPEGTVLREGDDIYVRRNKAWIFIIRLGLGEV